MYGQQTSPGITLRQLVLKDFMAAIVAGPPIAGTNMDETIRKVTATANKLTDAYFAELNK